MTKDEEPVINKKVLIVGFAIIAILITIIVAANLSGGLT